MQKNENIKISFLGIKFECTNPTTKTIILTVLLLTFFAVVVASLPKLSLVRLLSG
jgi:hydrogenase maturation factor